MVRLKAGMAAAMLTALSAGSALADSVVVRVQGGAFTPGQILAGGTAVTLAAGAELTLMSQTGKTLTLTGPYSGIPEAQEAPAEDPKLTHALSRLLSSAAADTGSLGVSRTTAGRDSTAIDPKGGIHCQVAGQPPVFKRTTAVGVVHLGLITAAGNQATVTWADGAITAPWPVALPFREGSYLLQPDSQPNSVKLTVRQVPAEIQGPAQVAVWMADHDCQVQALALLNSLR